METSLLLDQDWTPSCNRWRRKKGTVHWSWILRDVTLIHLKFSFTIHFKVRTGYYTLMFVIGTRGGGGIVISTFPGPYNWYVLCLFIGTQKWPGPEHFYWNSVPITRINFVLIVNKTRGGGSRYWYCNETLVF